MATYDLIIRGADLIDGTGAPARRADLAVAGDRIAQIGRIAPSLGYRVIEQPASRLPLALSISTHTPIIICCFSRRPTAPFDRG